MSDQSVLVTRAVTFAVDVSPSQERLLASYCGARRFAYNWVLGVVRENLDTRRLEREAGVAEGDLTPALSWSAFSLNRLWNEVKDGVAPWWREVSMHAFRSGITDAAAALKNWSESRRGIRKGRPVGFPRFKTRKNSTPSVSFVEINHQLSWLHESRHGVRLMLPQSTPDRGVKRRRGELAWLHTVESTRRAYRLVETGKATIQKVTVAKRGGRWQVSFLIRHLEPKSVRTPKAKPQHGTSIGVDAGVKHLATLSRPVPGLTDDDGHVPNPNVLNNQMRRLRRLDRAIARCQPGSDNRRTLLERRALLHGRIAKTRQLALHELTNAIADGFDVVVIEDLNVAGIANRKRRLGRALADVSLGELRRQLTYKIAARDKHLVVVGRFYPSSKTCSSCGAVKAKLPLHVRVYDCDQCGASLDRDINAAINIECEGLRLQTEQQDQHDQQDVAGLRPETRNADPRPRKTSKAQAALAAVA